MYSTNQAKVIAIKSAPDFAKKQREGLDMAWQLRIKAMRIADNEPGQNESNVIENGEHQAGSKRKYKAANKQGEDNGNINRVPKANDRDSLRQSTGAN